MLLSHFIRRSVCTMAIILMKNWMALFHLSCFSLAGSVCVFCDRALSLNHLHLVHRYTSDRANRTTNSGVSLRLACENYPSQFILSAELSLSKSAWNVTRGEYANREWEENEIEKRKKNMNRARGTKNWFVSVFVSITIRQRSAETGWSSIRHMKEILHKFDAKRDL